MCPASYGKEPAGKSGGISSFRRRLPACWRLETAAGNTGGIEIGTNKVNRTGLEQVLFGWVRCPSF